MLERITAGDVPKKPHTQLHTQGSLCFEHCLTRDGFDGPYTIFYHLSRPQAFRVGSTEFTWPMKRSAAFSPLRRYHLPARAEHVPGGTPLSARTLLLYNEHLTVSRLCPDASADYYYCNSDGDLLLFIQEGAGVMLSAFGSLAFGPKDYVIIPKGVPHRLLLSGSVQHWLELEVSGTLRIPQSYTNSRGQLRMDAPYSHRDFRHAVFQGPLDEGIRRVITKRCNQLFELEYANSPLDVVGYDGSIYPLCFPIRRFQPKVSSVHLPPTAHATFEAPGALVCSFVPRPLDFHPSAVPCPYPHSSLDIDEVLFYSEGDFTSRRGVGPGSLSVHLRGLPHGPQPGKYESSIGQQRTDELAVMLDCSKPLLLTEEALDAADPHYEPSFA